MKREVRIVGAPESKARFRKKRKVRIVRSRFEVKGAQERRERIWSRILDLWRKIRGFHIHVLNYYTLMVTVWFFVFLIFVVLLEYSLIPVYLTEFNTNPRPALDLVDIIFWMEPIIHLFFGLCTAVMLAFWCVNAIQKSVEPYEFVRNLELIEHIKAVESGEPAYSEDGLKPPCPECQTPMVVSARREYKFLLTCPRCGYEGEYKLKRVKA